MKLLAVDLNYPENSRYIEPKSAGVFMCGRLLTRWPLLAVSANKAITHIKLTSAEIGDIQEEVNRQLEVLELHERIEELTSELRAAIRKNNAAA